MEKTENGLLNIIAHQEKAINKLHCAYSYIFKLQWEKTVSQIDQKSS